MRVVLIVLLCSALGCDALPRTGEDLIRTSSPPVLAWTQVVPVVDSSTGHRQAVEARWVIEDTTAQCSEWTLTSASGGPVAGATRVQGAEQFPITVCFGRLDGAWSDVTLTGPAGETATLEGWGHVTSTVAAGKPVVLLGDTGCRTGENACDTTDTLNWGLPAVLSGASAEEPALFLHAGDYRYLGEDQGVTTDMWARWKAEFIVPLAGSASVAPWILARGNHEQCNTSAPTYGQGYWMLLGPDARTSCPDLGDVLHDTWYADVSASDSTTHRFVVIDTSNPSDSALADRFALALARSGELTTAQGYVRWLHHHPLISFDRYSSGGREVDELSDPSARAQYAAGLTSWRGARPATPLCDSAGRCLFQADIVSHQHFFAYVGYATRGQVTAWPETVVVGNGGVDLRTAGFSPATCNPTTVYKRAPTAWTATVHYQAVWGHVSAVLATRVDRATPTGWTAVLPVSQPSMALGPQGGARERACVHGKDPVTWKMDFSATALGFRSE